MGKGGTGLTDAESISAAAEIGNRLAVIRAALGYDTQEAMAEALRTVVGTQTTRSRISEWEAGKEPSAETLAAISLLHHDPARCLLYLRNGGDLPPTRTGFRPWMHQRPNHPESPYPELGDREVWRAVEEALVRAYDKMLARNELQGRADTQLVAVEFLYTMAATLRDMGEDSTDLEQVARRLLRAARGQAQAP